MVTASSASTRERLVQAAMELFWAQGFERTSIAQILERARVNAGSLYHYFRNKGDLLLGVLDRYLERLWPAVVEPAFARAQDPVDRVFALLAGYREGLLASGLAGGCPIGNLALEVSDTHPIAQAKVAENFDGWASWVRKCLDAAADRLPAELDRDALARFVLTVMEGAVMQARAHKSIKPFDASVAMLRDYIDRLLEAARAA